MKIVTYPIEMTEEEHAELKDSAWKAKMTIKDFIRSAILEKKDKLYKQIV